MVVVSGKSLVRGSNLNLVFAKFAAYSALVI
jgi:hypothetical protein